MPENDSRPHHLRIHINRSPFHSPNPTTAAALYALSEVPAGQVLFREAQGDHEDEFIKNDEHEMYLREDEHFYSAVLEFKIVVNSREKVVTSQEVSFSQVVALAFNPVPSGPDIIFTILYELGPRVNHEGTMPEDGVLKVKNGMTFYVTRTDKS